LGSHIKHAALSERPDDDLFYNDIELLVK